MPQPRKKRPTTARALKMGRRVLRIEAEAIAAIEDRLGDDFLAAVETILACSGRVIVSGIGKSGHISSKIASTLSSTGTPAYFVHAAEAIHGDLGMITRDDVVIAISNSGTTEELLTIVPLLKREGAKLIAITGNPKSPLAMEADVHIDAHVSEEACPLNLAPTASTTVALALGDALAVALLDAREFRAEDFARSHPGGRLGRRLLVHVRDIMRKNKKIPEVEVSASVAEALLEMSKKGMGMVVMVDADHKPKGIFTDGDLRRAIEHDVDLKRTPINKLMTRNPHTITADQLAAEAVDFMERYKTYVLPVVDRDGKLVGALSMHDLFEARIV